MKKSKIKLAPLNFTLLQNNIKQKFKIINSKHKIIKSEELI